MFNIKKEVVLILLIIFLVPIVYAGFFDLFKGIEDITGRDAITASIVIGNNAPNISDVSIAGQTWAPLEGDVRVIEVSFLANDAEGTANLDDVSANVNVSYQSSEGAGLLSNENKTCDVVNIDSDTNNYTCGVIMQYFWDHSTAWTVDAQINDTNNNFAMNSSNNNATDADPGTNWTYSELVAGNLSGTSLAWATVAPGDTNASSTTNLSLENTGNSLSLNIADTMIDLGLSAGGATFIPAGNFTAFNNTNTDKVECDFLNQTAAATPGVAPLVGINATAVRHLTNTLRRGGAASNFGLINVCISSVPADLAAGTYDTTSGGTWTIVEEDSGQ